MYFVSHPVLSCFSLLLEMKEEKSSMFSEKLSKIRGLFLSARQVRKMYISMIEGSGVFLAAL